MERPDALVPLGQRALTSLISKTAPARTPTQPPIQYDPVGGRVGVRTGADSVSAKQTLTGPPLVSPAPRT